MHNYCVAGSFRLGMPPAIMGEFYPTIFLFHVTDYIEPMVILTAWMIIKQRYVDWAVQQNFRLYGMF